MKENNELLQRSNKHLDEFVYIVSHDLKAPLRGLSSLATFLEDELGDSPKPEVLDLLNMMKSRTSRMQQLIDGILHYSRLANTKGHSELVDFMVFALMNKDVKLLGIGEFDLGRF